MDRKPTEEFYLRQFAAWSREYDDATSLLISLDAVIFEGGELIGPDDSKLGDDFRGLRQRKAGSLPLIFNRVQEEMRTYPYARLSRDPLALYQRLAIEHVSIWHRKHQDGTLSNALRSARKEPFVIRRRMD